MVPSMINIGHRDVAITEEINASQDARWRQLEAAEARKSARSKSPQDGISPAPPPKPPKPKPEQPKPKPAKTPAPGKPGTSSGPARSSSPSERSHPAAAGLAPGSVVLSKAEAEAVDHLLAHPEVQKLIKAKPR